MIVSKSRSDILLEERIAQIDDINFDKIYDVEEFATKQIEDYEEQSFNEQDFDFLDAPTASISAAEPDAVFEMEVQPNEFLDNYIWKNEEQEQTKKEKKKFFISNKPLFFAFTSIAFLLGILLIYNVFVINSLSKNLNNAANLNVASAKVEYVESNKAENSFKNNVVKFENNNYLN